MGFEKQSRLSPLVNSFLKFRDVYALYSTLDQELELVNKIRALPSCPDHTLRKLRINLAYRRKTTQSTPAGFSQKLASPMTSSTNTYTGSFNPTPSTSQNPIALFPITTMPTFQSNLSSPVTPLSSTSTESPKPWKAYLEMVWPDVQSSPVKLILALVRPFDAQEDEVLSWIREKSSKTHVLVSSLTSPAESPTIAPEQIHTTRLSISPRLPSPAGLLTPASTLTPANSVSPEPMSVDGNPGPLLATPKLPVVALGDSNGFPVVNVIGGGQVEPALHEDEEDGEILPDAEPLRPLEPLEGTDLTVDLSASPFVASPPLLDRIRQAVINASKLPPPSVLPTNAEEFSRLFEPHEARLRQVLHKLGHSDVRETLQV